MRVNLRGPPHTSHVFLNRCLTHTNPFAPHPPVPFNACPRSLYLRAGCPSVPRPRPGSGACLSLSAATHSRLGLNRPRPRPPPSACVPSAPQSAAQAVSTLDYASIIGGELPEAPIYRPPSLICCLSPGGAAGPFPRRFGRYVSLVSIVCGCMHGWLVLVAERPFALTAGRAVGAAPFEFARVPPLSVAAALHATAHPVCCVCVCSGPLIAVVNAQAQAALTTLQYVSLSLVHLPPLAAPACTFLYESVLVCFYLMCVCAYKWCVSTCMCEREQA